MRNRCCIKKEVIPVQLQTQTLFGMAPQLFLEKHCRSIVEHYSVEWFIFDEKINLDEPIEPRFRALPALCYSAVTVRNRAGAEAHTKRPLHVYTSFSCSTTNSKSTCTKHPLIHS